MPFHVVEDLVIPLNPNSPKCDASKEMPNLDFFTKFLRNTLPKNCLLPIECIIIFGPHSAKIVHNSGSPTPRPPSLDAIPKFMLHGLARMRKTKNTLLRNWRRGDAGLPFIDGNRFVLNWPHKCRFLTRSKWVPYLWPIELVVIGKVTLSFIACACGSRIYK